MLTKELKLLRWLAVIFIVVYLGHQFYASVYNPLVTDMAVGDSSDVGVELDTYFVRTETLVSLNDGGYRSYAVSDGDRVAKNGTIVEVYPTAAEAAAGAEIIFLQKQIEMLETAQNYSDGDSADLSLLNRKISESLTELLDSSKSGSLAQSSESGETLLRCLNRKNIVTGGETGYGERIAALRSRVDELGSGFSGEKKSLLAENAGYFVSKVDGYESAVSAEDLPSLSAADFDGLTAAPVGENVIGKIVSDYEWYILAKVPIGESFRLAEGESARFHTGLDSAEELQTTVYSINREGNSDYAMVAFSCTVMNRELASARRMKMTLVTESYEGLKVNKKAVRMVDGKRGVYVYRGSEARFVPVDIIYTGESFVICKKENGDGVLRLYDEVVVKGKGLYDGKIID